MSRSVSAGLETSASLLGKQSVLYRKYNTSDLVQNCSFDEVAYLLIYGYLPTEQQLNAFSARIESFREIPDPIKRGIELCGEDVVLIDLVAMGIAMLRNLRPEGEVFTQFDVIESILASIASIAAYWKHWRLSGARISTRGNKGDSIVQHLLRVWTLEEPLAENVELMNRAMILNAEHGFAASTFAARIAISAKSDVYSAVLAAIGTMKGVFDGGAAEIAALLFSMNSVEQVEKHVILKLERILGLCLTFVLI
jgi:2-methylcitrate synthase